MDTLITFLGATNSKFGRRDAEDTNVFIEIADIGLAVYHVVVASVGDSGSYAHV